MNKERENKLALTGRSAPMSSLKQLQFMQSWGERRQLVENSATAAAANHTADDKRGSRGQLTFVPTTAWQGLPDDTTEAKDDAANESVDKAGEGQQQLQDDAVVEAGDPWAPTLSLTEPSDESLGAASVQSLCDLDAGAASSPDGSLSESGPAPPKPSHPPSRDSTELGTMLWNIRRGRRHLYADDPFAVRLEAGIRDELLAELDRQNRLDARLEGESVETPGPSSDDAAEHGANTESETAVQAAAAAKESDSPRLVWSSRGRDDGGEGGSGGVESDGVVHGGGGGGGGLAARLKQRLVHRNRRQPAIPEASAAASAAAVAAAPLHSGSSSSSSSNDSDSDDSERQRINHRCRWRKSRVVSTGSDNGANDSNSSRLRRQRQLGQDQSLNRNCSNGQSSKKVAGCGLNDSAVSDECSSPPGTAEASATEADDLRSVDSLQFSNSLPSKRQAYKVTDGAAQKPDTADSKNAGRGGSGSSNGRLGRRGNGMRFPEYNIDHDEQVNLGQVYHTVEQMGPSGTARILDPKNMVLQIDNSVPTKTPASQSFEENRGSIVFSPKTPARLTQTEPDSRLPVFHTRASVRQSRNSLSFLGQAERQEEQTMMRTEVLDASLNFADRKPRRRTMLNEMLTHGVVDSTKDDQMQRSAQLISEGMIAQEQARQIVANRRSRQGYSMSRANTRSESTGQEVRRSSFFDLADDDLTEKKFRRGRHGHFNAGHVKPFSSAGFNNFQPQQFKDKDEDSDSERLNRNGSNGLGARLERAHYRGMKLRDAEMLAMHKTEPHFTSEGLPRENHPGTSNTNCCTDSQPSRTMVRRRCHQVVLIQPQMVHWDLQLTQVVANPKARLGRRRGPVSDDAPSCGTGSCGSNGDASDRQASRQSLPTVTSRSAALLADSTQGRHCGREAGGGGSSQLANWVRLEVLPRERRAVAKVKRIGDYGRRKRIARTNCLHRNVSHCTEIVENPSLTVSCAGDNDDAGVLARQKHLVITNTTGSTTAAATAGSAEISPDAASVDVSDVTTATKTGSTDSTGERSFTLSSGRLRLLRRQQRCQWLPQRRQQQQQNVDYSLPMLRKRDKRHRLSPRRPHEAGEARPTDAPPIEEAAWFAPETYLHCTICRSDKRQSDSPDWPIIAKCAKRPKSCYSHSVRFLPSVSIFSGALSASRRLRGSSAPAAAANLLIACELTVAPKKPRCHRRRSSKATDSRETGQ